MLKSKRKLLSLFLAVTVTVSATQLTVWSEEETVIKDETIEESEEVSNEAQTDSETEQEETSEETDVEEEEESSRITDEDVLSDMVLYAENRGFALYVNEKTSLFGVKNKKTGFVWWSSPIHLEEDPIANATWKNTLASSVYYTFGDPVTFLTTGKKVFEPESTGLYKDSFTVEKAENGVKFVFTFNKQYTASDGGFDSYKTRIPLIITLHEGGITASVPVWGIVEEGTEKEGGSVLIDLDVLNGFGAASTEEEGFIFVPDGSGAIINFNNTTGSANPYEGKVYGRDYAIGQTTAPPVTQQVYLPVMGMVKRGEKTDNGMFAIIEKGDSAATVRANVSKQNNTSYNNVWFEFRLRSTDTYSMGTLNKELKVYEQYGMKNDEIRIKYFLMDGKNLSYTHLADTYRTYLINEQGLTKKTTEHAAPYYLTLYGGTMKQQSILGFPVQLQTPATTYSQALKILQTLEQNGVDDIVVTYHDFDTAGIKGQISAGMDYAGKLGGKKDFDTLMQHIRQNNHLLFPALDILEMHDSGNGYSFTLNASKRISNAYATQTPYELAYGIPHFTKPSWSILSPYYWPDLFKKINDSFSNEHLQTISLSTASEKLYSDFSRINDQGERYYIREDSVRILTQGYASLKENGMTIMANSANAYVLPYVDFITNVPMYSSNYDIFDYDVPFYAMVVHGLIPYTTKEINASASMEKLILLCVSTGTPLHYGMMYEDPNEFTDSRYDHLYYANYKGWVDTSSEHYKLMKEYISSVSDATIVKYEYLSQHEIASEFSNGTEIYVNLDTYEIRINGETVTMFTFDWMGGGS